MHEYCYTLLVALFVDVHVFNDAVAALASGTGGKLDGVGKYAACHLFGMVCLI